MKNIRRLSMLLCLLVLFQIIALPARAADSDTVSDPETTEATEPSGAVIADVITEFGTAPILQGCRTLDGQVPLSGSEKMLSTARAAMVYELNTGTILYDYLPDEHVAPGGFAKIVSAMIALERGNLEDKVTISTRNYKTLAPGAINAKLKEGEIMTLQDLLNCMILALANDAALSIAEHIAGSETEFVKLMNEKVREIGCKDTVFVNCHGLDAAGQYSSARDMTRVIQYAVRDQKFVELFGTTRYTIEETNKFEERKLVTLNYLLQQTNVLKFIKDEVTGGLASYSSGSGASVFFTAESKGMSFIFIIVGSTRIFSDRGLATTYGNFEDAWTLMDYAFDNFKLCRLLHDGQSMVQFPVANGQNDVVAQTHSALDAILPKNARLDNLILKYSVTNGGLIAPLAEDQKIGTLQVWYRNTSCIAETELYSMSAVRKADENNLKIQSAASGSNISISGALRVIGIALICLVGLFAVYLIINNIRRSIALKRRRRRRASRRRSR